jgi:hypothetical protein
MRLDHDHVRTIARAFDSDDNGERRFRINMTALKQAMRRLSLWESGLLSAQLMRAARTKRPNKDQRVLLALFADRGEGR